jgi:hypothetical protein
MAQNKRRSKAAYERVGKVRRNLDGLEIPQIDFGQVFGKLET